METIIFKTHKDSEFTQMTDNYEARDVIDKETLSTVKSWDTYKYGFTDIETEYAPLGLNDIVRLTFEKICEPVGCLIGVSWLLIDGKK